MYAKQVDFGINLTFHQIAFVPNARLVIFQNIANQGKFTKDLWQNVTSESPIKHFTR